MLGEFLYALQPQEAVSAPVAQRTTRYLDNGAGAVDDAFALDVYTVPKDKCLLLKHVHTFVMPGAGQTIISHALSIVQPASPPSFAGRILTARPDIANPGTENFQMRVDCLVMPEETLEWTYTFSAAPINVNFAAAAIWGVLIPRGNLQYG